MTMGDTGSERGFTLIELLVVVAIIGILAALAMAGYQQARARAAEASAISSLRAITVAQSAFAQTCGNQRYAPTLTSLGTPAPSSNEPFLSPDLTGSDTIQKSGYRITMAGTPAPDAEPACNGSAPVAGYQVTADPVNPGISGVRYFGTNSDATIYADAATFAGNMPETGAPGHGTELR